MNNNFCNSLLYKTRLYHFDVGGLIAPVTIICMSFDRDILYHVFFKLFVLVKLRNDFYFGAVHADWMCMRELANPYSALPCGREVGGLFKWMTNDKQT